MKHAAALVTILCTSLTLSLCVEAHEDERIPDGAPDRVGEVLFPISCNAAAQQEFNRAVAMLHSFLYPTAGKTFARVTELDPACAMGYWGVAMSWWYPLWYPPTKDSLKQLHSMDYLVYAYLQGGQSGAAQTVVNDLIAVVVEDAARTLPVDYALAAAPARFALEQRRWADATALTPRASRFPATQALTHYARAIGAAHMGTPSEVTREVQSLAQIRDALLQSKQDYWAKQVEVQRRSAEAWLVKAAGDIPQAIALMRSAVDLEESTYKHPITPGQLLPARELMGDLLLESGQPRQALAEYERSLQLNPNRFNSLYGAARSAELLDARDKAALYYRQLLELSQAGDGTRSELAQAKLFLAGR